MALQRLDAAFDTQRIFMDKYGDQLEQLLQLAVYFVPVEDDEHDVAGFYGQVIYSTTDLFNLYRVVLLRAPNEVPVAGGGLLQRRYTVAAFLLRALRSTQVLLEMHAMRSGGPGRALRLCIRVEVIKLVLKFILWSTMPFSFYVDEEALEEAEPPLRGRRSPLTAGSPTQLQQPQPYVGRRSGRALPRSTQVGTAAESDSAVALTPPELMLKDRSSSSTPMLVAELLHHARPLTQLLMIARRGSKSWVAWFLALFMDRLSAVLLSSQVNARQGSRAARLEVAEVSRRNHQVLWALVRSPFFDKFLQRPTEALDSIIRRIPVINLFNFVELFMALRQFYFTTSAS